jgi:hypothetical protein
MNSSNVIEVMPDQDPKSGLHVVTRPQLVMGLLPCLNQFLLSAVAPVIMPGLKEIEEANMESFTVFRVMMDILYGNKQLHMGYVDRTGTAKTENFQQEFASKLQTPEKDYIGFVITEPLRTAGFHIFAVYIMPEFRASNMMQLGFAYIEGEAKKMGSPYLSLATRHDASGALSHFGFVETTSNYRKKLSKE